MKLLRLFFAPLISLAALCRAIFRAVLRAFQPLADLTFPILRPAREEAARYGRLRSRYESFVDRARAHDLFVAGHFDPGRLRA